MCIYFIHKPFPIIQSTQTAVLFPPTILVEILSYPLLSAEWGGATVSVEFKSQQEYFFES